MGGTFRKMKLKTRTKVLGNLSITPQTLASFYPFLQTKKV